MFKFVFTPLVIPSVYEENLSYLQQIIQLYDEFNKLGGSLEESFACVESTLRQELNQAFYQFRNETDEFIIARVKEKFEEFKTTLGADFNKRLKAIEGDVYNLQRSDTNIRKRIADLDEKMQKRLTQQYENMVTYLDYKIDELKIVVNAQIETQLQHILEAELRANHYTDVAVEHLRLKQQVTIDKFARMLDELASVPEVKNPLDQKVEPLYNVLVKMYNALSAGGATFEEIERSEITVGDFDEMNRTALNWDVEGSGILSDRTGEHYMFSPISGNRVTIQRVVKELADMLAPNAKTGFEMDRQEVSADEFDKGGIAVGEFDSTKNWTARDEFDTLHIANETVETQKLLWTNDNPAEPQTGAIVGLSGDYDEYALEYTSGIGNKTKTIFFNGGLGDFTLLGASKELEGKDKRLYMRTVSPVREIDGSLSLNTGTCYSYDTYKLPSSSPKWIEELANDNLVIVKVYGVRRSKNLRELNDLALP